MKSFTNQLLALVNFFLILSFTPQTVFGQAAPSITCPTAPQLVDDLSGNDGNFYNAMNYWDAVISSHDMAEAETVIALTASSNCATGTLQFRYRLALDMDLNGSRETILDSDNLPPAGQLWYNNSVSSGTLWGFDFRSVPAANKFRFGLQMSSPTTGQYEARIIWANSVGNTVPPQLPYGNHLVTWTVTNSCGATATCSYEIKIADKKKPTIVCINGLSANLMNMQGGVINLWASDLLQYTEDNYTPSGQIKIAIRQKGRADGMGSTTGFPKNQDGTPQTGTLFTCADLGTQTVELWSQDKANNIEFCETYILIQDNAYVCSSIPPTSGAIKTPLFEGVEEVSVCLEGSGSSGIPPFYGVVFSTVTGGYYLQPGFPLVPSLRIVPKLALDPLNGVNTWDLILISRHILGIEPLDSPYKMINADANKSGTITTFDIVELRKMILGTYTALPNNSSWRFVQKNQVFTNPANPFADTLRESITVGQVQSMLINTDFVGCKIGDIDFSAVPNNFVTTDDRHLAVAELPFTDFTPTAGEVFELRFDPKIPAEGFQFSLDMNDLELVEFMPDGELNADNYHLTATSTGQRFNFMTELSGQSFTLRLRARTGGRPLSQLLQLATDGVRSLHFDAAGEVRRLELRFAKEASIASVVGAPNPWSTETQIRFNLVQNASVQIILTDALGRTVVTQNFNGVQGWNSCTFTGQQVPQAGTYWAQVRVGGVVLSTVSLVKQ